ncbi:unnamed protein product [Polarella glacialis]|uniref:Uncharacterized protein n=1 Tax=Polarella glacialis TaxID=89957 RepID=A0A813E0T2_POLGL|nr:unnamed protein product [Polarella glacialis]
MQHRTPQISRLEFSDDWVVEAFDAGLGQEMVAACSFSICDATGVKLVEISASELECSGLPRCDLFAGTSHGVPADFPLKVCFAVPKARSSAWLKASSPGGDALPISPGKLREEFSRNLLCKPLLLGGPVSLARIVSVCFAKHS